MTAEASDAPALTRERASPLEAVARRLRSLVRRSEFSLVILAAVIGIAAGLSVALIGTLSSDMHNLLFGVGGERLSGVKHLKRGHAAPILGGVFLGVGAWLWSRRRPTVPVDPIEANALHGGRMSLRDSLWVTAQTLISNGFGASVGLEAGYAQVGAGLASKLGSMLRLRRNDLRMLVGCGAGGAIGAAFGAPLTGAFYAFELIVGTYTVQSAAPILVASLAGVLTARAVRATTYVIHAPAAGVLNLSDYLSVVLLGLLCAAVGIAVMRAVYLMERLFDWTRLPRGVRPAIGGCVLGGLSLITPQVLAAGHGALTVDIPARLTLSALLFLVALKAAASVVSLGSGFRGGLFFASLFLGALMGKLFAVAVALAAPQIALDPTLCILVGMSSLAVAVVGGPLTMSFLVLETTGDFTVTSVVLAASLVTSLAVRETFGYSFSTWRLHLRGETIRSAIDVGWMRMLTVGRMMRRDPSTIPASASLKELRRRYPLGSTQRVVVVDDIGRYLGIAMVAEAFASADRPEEDAGRTAGDLARWADTALTPDMNVKEAVAIFDRTESEALAVVDDLASRKVIGLLTEGYALRRYSEELDKARQGLTGGG
ncbi:MAG TPA: chloride channel protein [Caulobacteraceae bacterium]|jgi:CIC family chloride channel protein|nr:chloride channel protein [Caulobacteraceae bacterium]